MSPGERLDGVEPYEIEVFGKRAGEFVMHLLRMRWPEQPADQGWALGTDLAAAREVCDYWQSEYDLRSLERFNQLGSSMWDGIHFLRAGERGELPVVLLHGWPSGPIEYEFAVARLVEAGIDVIVPSLPGFAWSDDPGEPLNVAGMAARLGALLFEGLGLERCVIAGGDWGGIIGARIAFDSPDRVAGLYVSTPGVLPRPADLADPPMSEDEQAYAERAMSWLRREGHHMAIQSTAPDAISPALNDSPAGLAAYLLEKYRRWSDSGGDLGRRFSNDQLCDFLSMFWFTDSIAPSMRLYWAERRDRWRLAPGERIEVPAAIGVFPGDSEGETDFGTLATLNPPREWSGRVLSDLRQWTQHPSGGHFAAFEEPELYVEDLTEFLGELR